MLLRCGQPFGKGRGHARHDSKHPRAIREYAWGRHCENCIAHQAPYRTAIGAAAGEPPRGAPYQHHALKRFFAIADAWELSPLQQCRLLQDSFAPGAGALSAGPGAAAVGHAAGAGGVDRQYPAIPDAPSRAPRIAPGPGCTRRSKAPPFEGDSPLYFMLENGLPAMREVARLLVRESEPR